ncbi:MAG: glycoside hydrolase family 3 protein [Acidimicrobiales bacterium]
MAPVVDFDMDIAGTELAGGVGGILFLGNAAPPADLAAKIRYREMASRADPAPLVMADEEGGGVQRLAGAVPPMPWARLLAATTSPAGARALAASVGRQMRLLGVNVDLAPVLDVDGRAGPSPKNPDGLRSFSPSPAVAGRYGIAMLQGLRAGGVMPVVKHFPGLGGSQTNTDYGSAATLPIATLRTGGLLPFEAAIAAGAPSVMISNAMVPGLTSQPASLSSAVIDGLLRNQLGFTGLVMTDSLSAAAISQAGYSLETAAVDSIAAGSDMVLWGAVPAPSPTPSPVGRPVANTVSRLDTAIVEAVRSGRLPVERLDDAVAHVLAAKDVHLCPSPRQAHEGLAGAAE